MPRRLLIYAHRWAGLTIALVLIVSGLTGAVLPYAEQLNHWAAPRLWAAAPPAPGVQPLSGIELMRRVEAQTGASVRYMPLHLDPQFAEGVFVRSRLGQSKLAYDEVIADPYTGAIRQRVRYGRLADGSVNLIPFLLELHYSLAAGPMGSLVFGVASVVWVLVCLIGFCLTLPRMRTLRSMLWLWAPAWSVRTHAGFRALVYDLHRASGLWLWPALLVFAWSAVAFNLPQAHDPVNRLLGGRGLYESPANPTPADGAPMSLDSAVARGEVLMRQEVSEHGFSIAQGYALTLDPRAHAIGYYARTSLDAPTTQVGSTLVWFDAVSGRLLAFQPPFGTTVADRVDKWIRELHVAGVGGLPYKLVVSFLGLMTAGLSLTGVVLWVRRHVRSRHIAPALIREKTCPACRSAFGCGPGLSQNGRGCWCNDLPVLRDRSHQGCLCPTCLAARIAAQGADADAALPLARR